MKTLDTEREPVPVYLQRYADELHLLQQSVTAARTHTSVAADVRVHPKDRALIARIDAVLDQYQQQTPIATTGDVRERSAT